MTATAAPANTVHRASIRGGQLSHVAHEAKGLAPVAIAAMYGSADAVNMGGPNDPGSIVGAEAIGAATTRPHPGAISLSNAWHDHSNRSFETRTQRLLRINKGDWNGRIKGARYTRLHSGHHRHGNTLHRNKLQQHWR